MGQQQPRAQHAQSVKPRQVVQPLRQRPQAAARGVQAVKGDAGGEHVLRHGDRRLLRLFCLFAPAARGFDGAARLFFILRRAGRVRGLAQQRDKVPLAPDLMRVQVDIAPAARGQARQLERLQSKLRMRRRKAREHALVLRIVERAGGIHQRAAGGEHLRRRLEDFQLPVRAAARAACAPLVPGFGLPPKHALAGARRVHQNPVKERREPGSELRGHRAGHDSIAHAHALHVARENLRAGRHRLVAHEQPAPLHQARDLRALAAGRSAQVEHPLAGLWGKHAHGRQGAGLLQIEQPALVQRGQAGARIALHKVASLRPRHALAHALNGAGQAAVRAQQQVHAQRAGDGLAKRLFVRKKACFTEQAFHLGNISLGQGIHRASFSSSRVA